MQIKIEKGALVIRIPAKVLESATNNHPEFWDAEKDRQTIKVTDRKQWLTAVRDALLDEEEDGSTRLTSALDRAIAHAVEQGEEGVEFLDESSGGTGNEA